MAKTQSEGRGTKQRSWVSQEGGLYISIVCPWTSTAQSLAEALKEPGVLPYWHISVAIILRDLIQDLAPSERPLIKWPNDIYLGTEKCAGILMQACLANATRPEEAVIVGIGLNLNQEQFPSDVPATSLRLKTRMLQYKHGRRRVDRQISRFSIS